MHGGGGGGAGRKLPCLGCIARTLAGTVSFVADSGEIPSRRSRPRFNNLTHVDGPPQHIHDFNLAFLANVVLFPAVLRSEAGVWHKLPDLLSFRCKASFRVQLIHVPPNHAKLKGSSEDDMLLVVLSCICQDSWLMLTCVVL